MPRTVQIDSQPRYSIVTTLIHHWAQSACLPDRHSVSHRAGLGSVLVYRGSRGWMNDCKAPQNVTMFFCLPFAKMPGCVHPIKWLCKATFGQLVQCLLYKSTRECHPKKKKNTKKHMELFEEHAQTYNMLTLTKPNVSRIRVGRLLGPWLFWRTARHSLTPGRWRSITQFFNINISSLQH